jgi:hypothetical protein
MRNGAVPFLSINLHLNVVPFGGAGDRPLHVNSHQIVFVECASTTPKVRVLELANDGMCLLPLLII